ncbi:MAG: hypothetical protein P8104_10745 [Gammaproteobacteria bacterium]
MTTTISAVSGGAASETEHDVSSSERSTRSCARDRDKDDVEDNNGMLVNVEAQFAALFQNGFFSATPSIAMDPDGAGGALTAAPQTESASQILFRMHNQDTICG